MKGVVFPGDRKVAYIDVPVPKPGPLDVIVEMKASGMCGTDLQNYRRASDQPPYMPPLIDRPPIDACDVFWRPIRRFAAFTPSGACWTMCGRVAGPGGWRAVGLDLASMRIAR